MTSQNGTPWIEEDATPKSKEAAEHFLSIGVDIHGMLAERYLFEVRRLDPPYPDDFKYVENARTGEGALLVPLYYQGRVAIQLIHLDRDGRKSTVEPTKQRFSLECAPAATFVLPYEGDSTDIVICEGVEDALTVWRYGAMRCRVLGLPGIGALRHQQFPPGTKITVIADGDPVGSKGAEMLQKGLDSLILQGCDVHVTQTPPEGWDANRFLVERGVDDLRTFLSSARPAQLSDHAEIRRLAMLPYLAYGKERLAAAKKLKITAAILDKIVDSERRKIAEEKKQAEDDFVDIDSTRPWPEEVDGGELLDDLTKTLRSFVIMSKEAAWAIALWVVFTWVFAAAYVSLKLWIKSVERRSGKTRLVEVLSFLVCRPLVASSLTVAAFYRLVDEKCPTALMDEFDAWATENVEFRGILNAGFDKRNALKWVCVGDNHTPTAYNLFCPQVLAGIGSVPDTVADRSLKIDLIRKLRSEKVAKLRRRGTAALDELAQKCARWAADNIQDLMTAEPEAPESLNDRAADGWEILFAIANQVGEPWTQRAQIAAIKLSGDEYSIDDESVGAQLLYDIRAVLNENTSVGDKIPSVKLVGWLVDLEDRPWVEFTRESPLTPHKLARLLRKFEIRPGRDGKVRWYDRAKLIAACDRWAPEKPETTASEPIPNGHDSTPPGDSGFASVKASQPEEIRGSHANFKASSESSDDALKTARNPSETAVFDALTLSKPKNGSVAHEESFEPSDQTREQTLDQFRRAGDTGLGIGQMELMDISDDLVDELIAEGLLEELDRNGRRVRLVNKDEVVSNGLDAANDDGDPDADADDDLPVDVLARRLKSKNPSWSIKRIANELGQPESRIARYFAS